MAPAHMSFAVPFSHCYLPGGIVGTVVFHAGEPAELTAERCLPLPGPVDVSGLWTALKLTARAGVFTRLANRLGVNDTALSSGVIQELSFVFSSDCASWGCAGMTELQMEPILLAAISRGVVDARSSARIHEVGCVTKWLRQNEFVCSREPKYEGSTYGSTFYHSWLQVALHSPPLDGSVVVLGSSLGWQTWWYALTLGVVAHGYELSSRRVLCSQEAGRYCGVPDLATFTAGDAREVDLTTASLTYLTDLAWPRWVAEDVYVKMALEAPGLLVVGNTYNAVASLGKTLGYQPVATVSVPVSWSADQAFVVSRTPAAPPSSLLRALQFVAHEQATQRLLDAGADWKDNAQILFDAAARGRAGVVAALLRMDGDPNARNASGTPLIIVAVGSHEPKCYEAVRDAGGNESATDGRGNSAARLYEAAVAMKKKKVEKAAEELDVLSMPELVSGGLDAALRAVGSNAGADDPATLATANEVFAAAVSRRSAADLDAKVARSRQGLRPIHLVKEASVIHVLVGAGADLEAGDDSGRTALHHAAAADPPVATALLAAGANPSARDDEGMEPLHSAATAEVVASLVGAKASATARDATGVTPLHMAAAPDVVGALVRAGGDVDSRDEEGTTPLLNAGALGLEEVSFALLRFGADSTSANAAGDTACHFAAGWGLSKLVKELRRLAACEKRNHRDRSPEEIAELSGFAWKGLIR
mmetsp:Transcript_58272/g.134552  ORF Transcript_58272/g.134552 Transcript_58272/m.134552 type:complete len:706 (+) Transcript_58272:26-2143(+)